MKQTDKAFNIFLAMLFGGGCFIPLILLVLKFLYNEYWNGATAAFVFICTIFSIITYLLGGLCSWIFYKENQWWKLAGYLLLFTSSITLVDMLAISIVSCTRLKDILLIPLLTTGQWILSSILPIALISYITKSLIDRRRGQTHSHISK